MKKFTKYIILSLFTPSVFAVCINSFINDGNQINDKIITDMSTYKLFNVSKCLTNTSTDTISGSLNQDDNGYSIKYLLNQQNKQLLNQKVQFTAPTFNSAIGVIEDNIYYALTGKRGIFSSRIAVAVRDSDKKYKIIVTDYSGNNPTPVVISTEPITSLSWNVVGDKIAYVSYEDDKPIVFVQDIYNNARTIVANYSGSNSAPAFINNDLLVSLSKDYGTHIYKITADDYTAKKTATKLISNSSIDTEADYSNGVIAYTSNLSGKPEVYLANTSGGGSHQISSGGQNMTARLSTDGKQVIYIHQGKGGSNLMLYRNGGNQNITSGNVLSGTISPNGDLIAYIKNKKVYIQNLQNGYITQLPNTNYKDIYDVRWSK